MDSRKARRASRTSVVGRIITREDVDRTVGKGMATARAAKLLGVSYWTVWRACRDWNVPVPVRISRIKGAAAWRALYEQHGRNLSAISRATGMNRTYITRELERHGIHYVSLASRDAAGRWRSVLTDEERMAEEQVA